MSFQVAVGDAARDRPRNKEPTERTELTLSVFRGFRVLLVGASGRCNSALADAPSAVRPSCRNPGRPSRWASRPRSRWRHFFPQLEPRGAATTTGPVPLRRRESWRSTHTSRQSTASPPRPAPPRLLRVLRRAFPWPHHRRLRSLCLNMQMTRQSLLWPRLPPRIRHPFSRPRRRRPNAGRLPGQANSRKLSLRWASLDSAPRLATVRSSPRGRRPLKVGLFV